MPRKTGNPGRSVFKIASGFNEAAARCRGKLGQQVCDPSVRAASMRPRPDAAENKHDEIVILLGPQGFNEAAARCRGKRAPGEARKRHVPRRFNEAAARCRGKRRATPRTSWGAPRFNEAAARCRGKRPDPEDPDDVRRASMRPRPDAAENSLSAAMLSSLRTQLQ